MILSALIFTASATAIPNRPVKPEEQSEARKAFDEIAFDGPSARWRFEHVKNNALVCGYVNAKNQLGAYTGWQPFIFGLSDKTFSTYAERQWFFDLVCLDKPLTP